MCIIEISSADAASGPPFTRPRRCPATTGGRPTLASMTDPSPEDRPHWLAYGSAACALAGVAAWIFSLALLFVGGLGASVCAAAAAVVVGELRRRR